MTLLSASHRLSIKEIARACACSTNTVKNVFDSDESSGLEALLDKNRAHNQNSLNVYSAEKILWVRSRKCPELKTGRGLVVGKGRDSDQ